MVFDILLFRFLKNFVRGICWIALLHIILLLVFKFTCKKVSRNTALAIGREKREEKPTPGMRRDKKTDIVPYTLRVYDVLALATKPKEA